MTHSLLLLWDVASLNLKTSLQICLPTERIGKELKCNVIQLPYLPRSELMMRLVGHVDRASSV